MKNHMTEQTELFEDLLGDGDLDPPDDFLLGDEEAFVLLEAAINCCKLLLKLILILYLYNILNLMKINSFLNV